MTLLRHPRIYLSANGEFTHALLWDAEGRILALGDDALNQSQGHESVEPEGECVFPALCDAHLHLWGLALRPGTLSLRETKSTQEVYELLGAYNLADSPSGWVLGTDWDQHRWEGTKELSIQQLDQVFPDVPVCLRRVDGHALWVNSEALRRVAVSQDFDPGEGGVVGRDASGKLNGLLIDDAMNPVLEGIPEPTEAEDCQTFLETADLLIRHGITSAHMAWMPPERVEMLEKLEQSGELPLRLVLWLAAHLPQTEAYIAEGPRHDPAARLSIPAIKFFADGALGSQGAHLLEHYPDGSSGVIVDSPEFLEHRVPELMELGWQVAVHAIGDAAAHSVLNAFEAASPAARSQTRPRLEHAQMVEESDVQRFSELGVIASIQPIHMYSDAAWADEILNPAQLKRLFPWRALQAQALVCGGSDYPIEDPNPWHGIATAMSRKDRSGRVFQEEQALTIQEVLAAYTTGAAYAAFWEDRMGKLEPGYFADWVVLDRDPFASSPEEIWDTGVLQTWSAGSPLFVS